MSNERRRATSFDLILFRIPKTSGDTGNPQFWDEGVGYDYSDFNLAKNSAIGGSAPLTYVDSRAYSTRPSNWYQTTTIDNWSQPGIYNNKNEGLVNFSGLTIVARQHFDLGNEDINMDMTEEINGILNGSITGVTGWGLAYLPQIENITGLTDSYSVAFFSKYTQTFYQPYLLTNYDDLIVDDRNQFLKSQENKLFLYIYQNGDFANLDSDPVVRIQDRNGDAVTGMATLSTCLKTKGVYEVIVPNGFSGYPTPCMFYDVWSGLTINGQSLPNVQNQFILQPYTNGIQIGTVSQDPEIFGFNFFGIKQNEDKIPNQYFVDIQVNTSGEKDTYKQQLTFQIVNKK